MSREAQLKGRTVPIKDGESVVYFSGGEDGKDYEIGEYCFWVAEGEDEYGPWTVIARGLRELPAADRFQRMDQERKMTPDGKDRIAYQLCWDRFDTCTHIRPACLREIVRWFDTHAKEGEYASAIAEINGKKMPIPRSMV